MATKKTVKDTTKKKEVVKETKKKEIVKEEKKKINKKTIIIGSIIAGIVIIVVIVICAIFFNTKSILTRRVKTLGEEYYTKYFYPQLSKSASKKELKTVLSKYEGVGIKISLDNASHYSSDKYKKYKKSLKKYNCKTSTTKAVLYPQKPYGKKDYKVEVILDCDLKN